MKTCPLIKAPCSEHACMLYTHVLGIHPQTGKEVDQWGCTLTWIPMLLIANTQEQRQTAAAVESLRNVHDRAAAVASSAAIAAGLVPQLEEKT